MNKFIWPSPVRIGYEAESTINSSNVELKLSRETRTMNSSPKRYLWDEKIDFLEADMGDYEVARAAMDDVDVDVGAGSVGGVSDLRERMGKK